MKSPFVQPRFDGARFTEHTLPLEVTRDLVAYEALVIELAKYLWLKDHPGRERVPKGFADNFDLHLEKVDDGSAKPLLAWVAAGALALAGGSDDYFSKARDSIVECIAAPTDNLPAAFPKELLWHFNQVGRSLRDGEVLELETTDGGQKKTARLTPDRRKELVLAVNKVYEREVTLSGIIEEADWKKSTFRLRLLSGGEVTIPMLASFHDKARQYGGRPRHQVTVKAIANYDSHSNLQKVISVDSLEIQPNYQLAERFERLESLRNGWFDSQGKALPPDSLALVSDKFVEHYPDALPLPAIVPTQDGNLLVEWDAEGTPSVDINLTTMNADFHAFGSGDAEIEESFHLTDDTAWAALFKFLGKTLGEVRA